MRVPRRLRRAADLVEHPAYGLHAGHSGDWLRVMTQKDRFVVLRAGDGGGLVLRSLQQEARKRVGL